MSEIVIFIGIPASGKTSFYKERFFPSHVYVSLDQVRTRSAEGELLKFCLGRNRSCVRLTDNGFSVEDCHEGK